MMQGAATLTRDVHCRTGSLEIILTQQERQEHVHCRTGSLEIDKHILPYIGKVHCRTGSLEK